MLSKLGVLCFWWIMQGTEEPSTDRAKALTGSSARSSPCSLSHSIAIALRQSGSSDGSYDKKEHSQVDETPSWEPHSISNEAAEKTWLSPWLTLIGVFYVNGLLSVQDFTASDPF